MPFAIMTKPELSKREREIVKLKRKGETDKGVAERLKISVHTVDQHLRRIRAKLRTQSTMAAIFLAA
jgi:DNA-binding CsgD family transcriptional regulator